MTTAPDFTIQYQGDTGCARRSAALRAEPIFVVSSLFAAAAIARGRHG